MELSIAFELHVREPVSTVDALMRDIVQVREAKDLHKLWFSGHSCASFKIVPSIGLPAKYASFERRFGREQEDQFLHRFQRRADPRLRERQQ